MTMKAQKVPTHMGMPDRIIFGLTPRQVLIMLIGCSLGYDIWLHLSVLLTYGVVGLVARLICSLVPAGLALAVALITIAGRPLEVWALVLLRYQLQPKIYVWYSLRTAAPTDASQQQKSSETAGKTRRLLPWKQGLHPGHRLKQAKRTGSVQSGFLTIRKVVHNVVCLASGTDHHEYRTIIEVEGTNFPLKAEDEQESIIAGYRAFLKALCFPIQILVRSQRLDLSEYIHTLQAATDPDDQTTWKELATSQIQFVQDLAAKRTLVEHRFYLIVPAEQAQLSRSPWPLSRLSRARRQREYRAHNVTLQKAQQQLDVRATSIMQQLTAIGLPCRRLAGEELITLSYSCLTPERAIRFPLTTEMIAVDQLPRVRERKKHAVVGASLQGWQAWEAKPETAWPSEPSSEQSEQATQPLADRTLAPAGLSSLADLLAPACVEVTRDWVCLEDEYACGIAVTSFPREVIAGWLAPLLLHDEIMEVVWHIHPQDNAMMLHQLMRRSTQYRASQQMSRRQGRLEDPQLAVAEQDVEALIGTLASGEERIFDVGMYLLVRATDTQSLAQRRDRVMALLQNLLVVARPTTLQQAQAFRSFLPEARNDLLRIFPLESASLATTFPFISNSLFMPRGVLSGITAAGEPVVIDAWDESLDNPHEFAGAITGAGKSYLCKIRIMRELLQYRKQGLQDVVIDPDGEYAPLCLALGGNALRLAPGSDQHLNPFDLVPAGIDLHEYMTDRSRGDRLADKVQALHALLDLMLADRTPSGATTLTAREKGLLDRAIYETYSRAGITADPRTHNRQVPLMRDLYQVLTDGVCGRDEFGLSDRLHRYVAGSLSGLFQSHTDIELGSHLVVFDIRELSGEELRPVGIFLITDFVWTQVLSSHRPRKLYIDEAWSLIQHPEGGRFLASLARRARKHYLALCTITQNPERFAQDVWGSVVASNAATKVLKKQDRTSAEALTRSFQLTTGERQRLLTCGKHEALLLTGDKRVQIQIQASPLEHALATTDPRELASRTPSHGLIGQSRRITIVLGHGATPEDAEGERR